MPKKFGDPKEKMFEDPDNPGGGIIEALYVKASGLYDESSPGGGTLWAKAKNVNRGDVWSLNGFGSAGKFQQWQMEEVDKMVTAFELWTGKKYGKQQYSCCCTAAHEK